MTSSSSGSRVSGGSITASDTRNHAGHCGRRHAPPRPGRTCLVSPPRDVIRAAAPITAAPAGPLAGTGPPAPAPPKLAPESLATPARSLDTARNYRQVH
jgi:hypothetical protein